MVYIKDRSSEEREYNTGDTMKKAINLSQDLRAISMGLEVAMGKLPKGVEEVWMATVSLMFKMSYALDNNIPGKELSSIPDSSITLEFEKQLKQLEEE